MKFISTSQVCERTGLSRSTIWRYRKRYYSFPSPVIISGLVRWVATEVDDWLLAHRFQDREV